MLTLSQTTQLTHITCAAGPKHSATVDRSISAKCRPKSNPVFKRENCQCSSYTRISEYVSVSSVVPSTVDFLLFCVTYCYELTVQNRSYCICSDNLGSSYIWRIWVNL